MDSRKKTAIILSISSDIAYEIASDFLKQNYLVIGTYKTTSNKIKDLKKKGAILYKLNLTNNSQINKITKKILKLAKNWDYFVSATGTLFPISKILNVNTFDWEQSIMINSILQIRFLKKILNNSRKQRRIIFFAGGGTNSAFDHYSSYTLSKIFLIKFTELLNHEEKNLIPTIIGPGWVKTKIHNETLKSKIKNFKNKEKTKKILSEKKTENFEKIIAFINWTLKQPKKVVGGRNFSIKNDNWGNKRLNKILLQDQNIYKLRRYKNDI